MARRGGTTRRHRLRSLAGAVLLGAGAILGSKPRPDDHWSRSPAAAVDVEAEADAAGEPPTDEGRTGRPDATGTPMPATRRATRRRRWWRRGGGRGGRSGRPAPN